MAVLLFAEDNMNILLLEDDKYIQDLLKENLLEHGFGIDVASNIDEFWEKYNKNIYNFYLIDVILPDGDGFKVCEQIRKNSKAPIIFLTSCDDEESTTKGLNCGADDYITKPFRMAELVARINANLRRIQMSAQDDNSAKVFKDITVDLDKLLMTKNGIEIEFSDIEWQLVDVLIRNAGLIVKREILLERVWDNKGNFVEDNTLTVAICRIKAKVGKEHIETIRGVGYRWIQ